MLSKEEIAFFMLEDASSQRKINAKAGQRYYDGEHDILNYRLFYYDADGELQEDKTRSNIKISHPFFTELVDQQAQYMLNGDKFVKSDDPVLQEELDKAEEKLLALFSPTVPSFGQSVSFDFIPSAQTSGKIEAFCFSESLGVLPAGSPEGTPYYLEISTDANCVLNAARPDTSDGQTIYYCVPSVCNVKIYYYDHVVCHLRVPVYQLGVNEMMNF